MIKKLVFIVLCTTLYTIIRYVIFGPVSPIQIPAYLLNKSVSMASMIFLFCAALHHKKGRVDKIRFWGMASFHFAFIHILLSFAILSSDYYPKFFGTGKMNLTGEVTVLFGVLAAYCFWFSISGRSVFIRLQIFRHLSIVFVVGHLVTMGFGGWLKVEKWYGGLPPISLVSFLFAIATLVLFFKTREKELC